MEFINTTDLIYDKLTKNSLFNELFSSITKEIFQNSIRSVDYLNIDELFDEEELFIDIPAKFLEYNYFTDCFRTVTQTIYKDYKTEEYIVTTIFDIKDQFDPICTIIKGVYYEDVMLFIFNNDGTTSSVIYKNEEEQICL